MLVSLSVHIHLAYEPITIKCNTSDVLPGTIKMTVISMAVGVQVSYVVTWLINKWH